MYVTGDYGTNVNDINYFEIDLKTKKVKSKWDKFNGKFEWNRTLLSVGEKYIKINHLDGEDYPKDNYELLDRETGKMSHVRFMANRNRQTPISMCEKINKGDLPVKQTDKKF